MSSTGGLDIFWNSPIPLAIPEAPMQFISVDIVTLPGDDDGYKCIFLTGDIFSKYIEAVPLRDQLDYASWKSILFIVGSRI